jgi:hypothetical protein
MKNEQIKRLVEIAERRLRLQSELEAADAEMLELAGELLDTVEAKSLPPASDDPPDDPPLRRRTGGCVNATTPAVLTLMHKDPAKSWTAKTLAVALPQFDRKTIGGVLTYRLQTGELRRKDGLYYVAKKA